MPEINPDNWEEVFISRGLGAYIEIAGGLFDELEPPTAEQLVARRGFDQVTAGHVAEALGWMYANTLIHGFGWEWRE